MFPRRPPRIDLLVKERREEQRCQTARRLIRIRFGAALAWFLYNAIFGLYGGHADFRQNLPLNGIYAAAAFALYLASLHSPAVVRRSWLSLPLLDLPLIFLMQYRATPLAHTPVGNAAFSVGILAILVVVAQLSMRVRNVLITAAVATILEIALLMRAGISLYGWLAAVIVLSTIGFAASAVVDEFAILLSDVVAERTRISRELHDTLAQGLAGISLQLEALGATMETAPNLAREHLDRASALARTTLAEARRSVWNLRSTPSSAADLPHALADLVGQLTLDTRARIHLDVVGSPRRLSPEIESNLTRIAQEALTNASKHSGAHSIEVDLRFERNSVLLSVRDNGFGFVDSEENRTAHFGLIGMRERAERIGGSLAVRSRQGRGTEIAVAI